MILLGLRDDDVRSKLVDIEDYELLTFDGDFPLDSDIVDEKSKCEEIRKILISIALFGRYFTEKKILSIDIRAE